MGRDLPASDSSGLADPFIILRWSGAREQSTIKTETLNPGWFETIEMKIKIPRIGTKGLPVSWVSLLWYDSDYFGQKDLLGRTLMDIEGKPKMIKESKGIIKYVSWREPEWYPLHFDALKEDKGFILVGYGLLTPEAAENHPIVSIVPPTIPGVVNVSVI